MHQYSPMTTVVLATHNQGKAREFAELLQPFAVQVITLAEFPELPEVEETGITFAANAYLKASEVSKATGLVALADDSGLEVDSLNKAPGVYSARYSATPGRPATDQRNVDKLLIDLSGIPDESRTGRFRCCMMAVTPNNKSITAEGSWEGRILRERLGFNGFGYDPIFFDPESGKSAAQMSKEEKNSKSHRAKAVSALLLEWPAFWQDWLEHCTKTV